MTAFSLFPSYVQIEYQSAFGLHLMTRPTKQWQESAGPAGEFETWVSGTIDADDMINALCDVLAVVAPSTTTFTQYVIYNFPDEESDPQPVASNTLGVVGLEATPGWTKAVEQTFTFRTEAFHIAKLILLDANTDNNFDRVPFSSFSSAYQDIFFELANTTNAWSGRDNARITQAIQASATLNEKLRREYRMF